MKRVLVTPLDWGLGHATRCIPVIQQLLGRNHEVMLGGDGGSFELLRKEFPQLHAISLPGYRPEYPANASMAWKMATQLLKFASVIRREHAMVRQVVRDFGIDAIVSDNRYGCWSRDATSILITHQSNVLMPRRFGWLAPAVRYLVHERIRKFDSCWLPDFPDKRLSGILTDFGSADGRPDMRFIGPISRFRRTENAAVRYDILAIISGPEPQRTIFENLLVGQLQKSNLRYFVVRGVPGSAAARFSDKMCDYMVTEELQQMIAAARIVVCRSGYSSVMDLATLGKKAIFVPTPGQTEQEYLASELKRSGIAYSISQKDFDLRLALQESEKYSGFTGFDDSNRLLEQTIAEMFG
ncbi:MAG TPA: glycosyltransferase [Chryseosolibacter sp.]|nr:glycosyltransferase [Chryseosolibacter sp.]